MADEKQFTLTSKKLLHCVSGCLDLLYFFADQLGVGCRAVSLVDMSIRCVCLSSLPAYFFCCLCSQSGRQSVDVMTRCTATQASGQRLKGEFVQCVTGGVLGSDVKHVKCPAWSYLAFLMACCMSLISMIRASAYRLASMGPLTFGISFATYRPVNHC